MAMCVTILDVAIVNKSAFFCPPICGYRRAKLFIRVNRGQKTKKPRDSEVIENIEAKKQVMVSAHSGNQVRAIY